MAGAFSFQFQREEEVSAARAVGALGALVLAVSFLKHRLTPVPV